MLSESARMASAHEARFRVAYPNSVPRSIKVVALDEPSRHLVDEVSRLPWNKASFFTSMSFEGDAARGRSSIKAWLSDIAGHTKDLIAEIDEAISSSWWRAPARTPRSLGHRRGLPGAERDHHRAGGAVSRDAARPTSPAR